MAESAASLVPEARRDEIAAAAKVDGTGARILTGSDPDWIGVEASALAAPEIRIGPPPAALSGAALDTLLRRALRTARLSKRALVVDLAGPEPETDGFWRALAPLLKLAGGEAWVFGASPASLLARAEGARLGLAALPPVSRADRAAAVQALVGPAPAAAELAARFRLPLARLGDVAILAGATPDDEDWRAAFRDAAAVGLPAWVRRMKPEGPADRSQLARLVLPETQQRQLETILSHVEADLGGLAILFAGESGTGKTRAARALAGALGVDLYAVDLARVAGKYIGETEKTLDSVFAAADRAGAVLLFEEAEPLFASRTKVRESRDRYADLDPAELVRRMERYRGLAILGLGHGREAGAPFARAIAFAVDFPMPGVAERERLWRAALPPDCLAQEADFALAARRLELTGGSIHRIASLAGAVRPGEPVGLDSLQIATRAELLRLGQQDRLALAEGLFARSTMIVSEVAEPAFDRPAPDEAELSARATLDRVMRLIDEYPHPAIGRRKVQALLRGLSGRVPAPDLRE
ncbi:MAG: AAA family ATPase [Allosphingosinicella sp.]